MNVSLLGFGTAVPEHCVAQEHAACLAAARHGGVASVERQLRALYRGTAIQSRHSVLLESSSNGELPHQSFFPPATSITDRGPTTGDRMARYALEAGALAQAASQRALQDCGIEPREITHLVTVSCTGFSAPGFDISLVRNLQLSPRTARTHVGFMGCHGALNALRVAKAYAAEPQARVLVCAVELCSLHFQYGSETSGLVANALFADGAAATVVGQQDSGGWSLAAQGSTLVDDAADAMAWRIGSHGFEMSLSPRLPIWIRRHLPGFIDEWLSSHGLTAADVRTWAVHPGGPRILEACQDALHLDRGDLAASWEVMASYGNMSSPTLLFVLQQLKSQQAPGPCVAIGFGPGLAIETALLR